MRKLIVTEFVSLDGVMEAPAGEAGYRLSSSQALQNGVLAQSYELVA